MIITANHSSGYLNLYCQVNGGKKEEDVLKINLLPNTSISVSDAFSTCNEIEQAVDEGLIIISNYETGDQTEMSRGKTTEILREVGTPVNVLNDSLDVSLQDQTTPVVNLNIVRVLQEGITLSSDSTIDTRTVSLTAGHGFSAGEIACIKEGTRYYQGTVTNVSVNNITLDSPLDYAYTTSAIVTRTSDALNVNGSVTPVIAKVSPKGMTSTVSWHITNVVFHIEGTDAMDDSLFGDQTALSNGIVLRWKDSIYKNIFNAKSNGELIDVCKIYNYDDRASNKGIYGFRCIKVFGGQQNDGVVIRLSASTEDELQVIIQDDLTALTHFHVMALGHTVDP